ncbi:hypothetical protein G6F65_017111 [Rhizopus arrhizus]|nr:hypothetical protein G6F65_017111 [Rhizopus arrhizus]
MGGQGGRVDPGLQQMHQRVRSYQQHGLPGFDPLAVDRDRVGQESPRVVQGRIVADDVVDDRLGIGAGRVGGQALPAGMDQGIAQQPGAGLAGLEQQADKVRGQYGSRNLRTRAVLAQRA